jgi:Flp pilus assembly protein protease CpaA
MELSIQKKLQVSSFAALLFLGINAMIFCFIQRSHGVTVEMLPLLIGHIVFAVMLVTVSNMDIHTYGVPNWMFNAMYAFGFVTHAVWSLTTSNPARWSKTFEFHLPASAAALASGIVVITLSMQKSLQTREQDYEEHEGDDHEEPILSLPVVVFQLIGVCIVLLLSLFEPMQKDLPWIAIAVLFGFFLYDLRLFSSAGTQTFEMIESEKSNVKRRMLAELIEFIPVISLGICVWYLVESTPNVRDFAQKILSHSWMQGLARSMIGWIVAGALGWTTRIVFSLIFGKEAYGDGDVLLLAAIGSMSGWEVAVLAFFLSSFFALALHVGGRKSDSAPIHPLIPGLTLATMIAIAYGPLILSWFGF